MVSTSRVQTVPLKTLTTRIYIDDAKTHKVVQLTNLLTTAMVVQYLRKKGLLDHSDDWTLFEIDNRRGVGKYLQKTSFKQKQKRDTFSIERPLREWEIVLDILSVWEMDASNALLVKKYSYHYTLTSEVCIGVSLGEVLALLKEHNRVFYRKKCLQCMVGYRSSIRKANGKRDSASLKIMLYTMLKITRYYTINIYQCLYTYMHLTKKYSLIRAPHLQFYVIWVHMMSILCFNN